ncbi:uncharacterized protein LOC126839984 [Adelges cooleyi]|uniref:uncharacterized protein LOC126839984 n=1 Tax=Adelges cooleyi TaxID=133065 RepID=UPI0021800C46|nr:uncharacterized protein LOC126839984 [Adelges cooleyi]
MVLDENAQKLLTELKRKRGVVKASLTRVRTFISKFDPSEQALSLLEFRQEELPQINRKFDGIQCEIELIDSDDTEEAELERDRFESEYFAIRSQIQEIINQEKGLNTTGHNQSYGGTYVPARVQLAPIPLPKFDGDIQKWSSFYDVFKAMVHNDDAYSVAQKFFYLRSCLEGSALDLVRSIPVSDANYETVVRRLIQRFDNQSLVIQSHIQSILDCPQVEEASSETINELYSCVCTQVAALKALNQPVEHWDAWLITIVTSRLDKGTAHSWLLHQKNTKLPKYSDLETFLASRCVALETSRTRSKPTGGASTISNVKKSNLVPKRSLVVSSATESCHCCSGNHKLYFCDKFKGFSLAERLSFVRKESLCFNCLSPRHLSNACKSIYTCRYCNRSHNTLLHFEKPKDVAKPKADDGTVSSPNQSTALLAGDGRAHVFLATAVIIVLDKFGNKCQCRVILDSGSQINFISKRLATLLQLPARKTCLPISGIGAKQVQAASSINIKVSSRVSDYEVDLLCYVLPNIVSALQSCAEPQGGWNIPSELIPQLADPDFDKHRAVDLLIGGGIFFDILGTERRMLLPAALCLQESQFGWVVTGELEATCLLGINSVGEALEEDWKALLLREDSGYGQTSKSNLKSLEETETVQHYHETAMRNENGRFVLRLPVKETVHKLGNSITMATSRFFSVERRLQRDQHLRTEYIKFMQEYLDMGHIKCVSNETTIPDRSYYLPHHAVLKTSSLTTKLRVVFDASANSSSGLSLNDVLKRGPTVQEELFAILARFRKYQYVITSDIEKMFRQIEISEQDWDLQRILWRADPSKTLQTYRLTTVTYGTTPASFLSTQCLISLAEQNEQTYPRASSVIRQDFYMDDLMTGCDTEAECLQLQQEVSTILDSAKMPLRKWCSNSESVLKGIGKNEQDPLFTLDISDDDTVKSLGLGWKPFIDDFRFNIIAISRDTKLTKRTLLSQLNRIFDPLGFLSPVLVKGKIFLKQLWQLKVDWDSPLQEELQKRWRLYYSELEKLKELSIPRKCIYNANALVELHGFCDASMEAYGACIYVRSLGYDGKWHAQLLCSKTRVAPLKGVTIPRLELNGAVLLVQLAYKVAESWKIDVQSFKLWTDSMIVLGWLNSDSSRLKTYVANRVVQILEVSTAEQWRHVRTDENPADVVSRGLRPQDLVDNNIWWTGPSWLSEDESGWPRIANVRMAEDDVPDLRTIRLALTGMIVPEMDMLQHHSEWSRLKRATAWLWRFIDYQWPRFSKVVHETSYLTVSELRRAESSILRRVQTEAFPEELRALQNGKELPTRSKLRCLHPFLKDGLILVGGRLKNANIPDTQRHPIVLPPSHKVTRLLMEYTHKELLHGGPQSMLAEMRRRYWPLRGRVMARSVAHKCVRCIRVKPTMLQPIMAPLPRDRVQCSRPFAISGVDFAGPLIIRSGVRRVSGRKAWIAVYVCFSTRAVHLEPVEDLTSSAFIASLRRFMARRGKCTKIYSDNGTNFVGAQKELSPCLAGIDDKMAKEGVEWHFNPPSAPHFGALWESAVKTTKFHLTRVIKDARLTLGELTTLLCQVEACVNSRPMTPLNSDPSEAEAITPAHFLIGGPMMIPPEANIPEEDVQHLRRWRFVQGLMQSFWRRWHAEYLPQLQVRGKWTYQKKDLVVGDVVIIKEDCTPPTKWKLGRVVQLHPGKDGTVRVVTLKTANNNELRRPAVKLCRLPIESEDNQDE